MKALENYEKIIDAVTMSNGKINPVEAVRGYLVGMQKFSKITRDSIGLKQATLENVEITKLVNAIINLGKDAWNDFSEGRIDLEIMREMLGEPTGVKGAKDIARILKESQNSWRLRLNDLGVVKVPGFDAPGAKVLFNRSALSNAPSISKAIKSLPCFFMIDFNCFECGSINSSSVGDSL